MSRISRLGVSLGSALLAVATLATSAGAASPSGAADKAEQTESVLAGAAVPGGFASWADLLAVQQRMNEAAAQVTAAGAAADSGYAGVVADPTKRQLTVYWKGEVPGGLIAGLDAGVPVKVLPAAYSQQELQEAADRLLAKAADRISTVGPRVDGAGLLVGTRTGLADASTLAGGVPVTVQTGVSAQAATRWDDSPPWWGGAAWRNANTGGGCSTGFAVSHQGAARMLTAAHCGTNGQVATDPTGQVIGPIIANAPGADTAIINGPSAGRVFNNTTNAAGQVVTEFSNPVIGVWNVAVGNFVCTSGAYSGTRCSIQVVATPICINIGVIVCNQAQAENTTRTNAVGQGDSGGPVEVVNANNTSQVFAAGTNTAIDAAGTSVPCTGYVPTGRICAWRMFFENITPGMAAVGAAGVILG